MHIHIQNRQKSVNLAGKRDCIRKIILAVLELEKKHCDELSIYFISDKKMRKMHEDFFDDDSPTDTMAFPIDQSYLGDIFICPETAVRYAADHNKDLYEEITLYIIHALLHLLGYDDLEATERKKMRAKERACMKVLKHKGLLLNGI